ncbi:hypothetical protein GCM10022381_34560 [Leifsonia kafniensis]|uniref:DUF1801 domain-containing protein n=1 Tax=Leifsonia kafniensis TaxID=475957 RepID=A0ABP7KZD4_9MICO
MHKSATSVDEYLEGLEGESGEAIRALDLLIHPLLNGLSRTLWEGVFRGGTEQQIIGYGDLVQTRSRGIEVEWFLIGLATQKNYLSLYVNAVEDGEYLGQQFAASIGASKVGDSSLSFARFEDIDLDVLTDLIIRARASVG